MAIIREKRTGAQDKTETRAKKDNSQTKNKIVRKNPVLASKLNRSPLTRQRRNADAKESAGDGQRNLRKESRKRMRALERNLGKESRKSMRELQRNLGKERKQREAPVSQMMFWLNQRNDNVAEARQFFLPPPQRYIIAKIDKIGLSWFYILLQTFIQISKSDAIQ